MTDEEIVQRCAEAMGLELFVGNTLIPAGKLMDESRIAKSAYDPLHDDAQCFALVDWLIDRGELWFGRNTMIYNEHSGGGHQFPVMNKEMRRSAICEFVAKMQAAK